MGQGQLKLTLPKFIVIGAMKSGTTTVFHDLLSHPQIFLPDKETSALIRDVTAHEYAAGFARAGASQICGDVSTLYSMLPDYQGVVERARKMLSPETRIIYIVREPVSRALSHHRHMNAHQGAGWMPADFDKCVDQFPSLLNYSRYAMQLEPWIDAFGLQSVHVIKFEDYTKQREIGLQNLLSFLGASPDCGEIDTSTIHNRSEGKPVMNAVISSLIASPAYRRLIRPWVSLRWRDRVRDLVCPKAPPAPEAPKLETIEFLVEQLQPDVQKLTRLLELPADLWDLKKVITKFAQPEEIAA